VRVPAPVWGLSNRACRHPLRLRLPVPIGFTSQPRSPNSALAVCIFSPQGSHAFNAWFHLLATHPPARWLQRVHDARLVWPLALQTSPLVWRHRSELGDRLHRVLHGGTSHRLGSAVYTTAQLKTMQEVITLLVFAGFSILYLKEPVTWNYVIGFVLIASGAYFVFRGPFSAALF
jgi:uncharacterized protein